MKYVVTAYRTKSLCKAFSVPELYKTEMMWGPWKRKSTAKRKRTELNKERVLVQIAVDDFADLGPAFRLVKIVEVPEEKK